MWIQTCDGMYIRDPVIIGDNWYIRFDEDVLVLYIKSQAKTVKSVRARVNKELRCLHIKAKLCDSDSMYTSTSAFPPAYAGIVSCWVGSVSLLAPLPPLVSFTCSLKVANRPQGVQIHGCT